MDNQEKLEDFLGKVLGSSNRNELGQDVLSILSHWKRELESEEANLKTAEPDIIDIKDINDNPTS